MTLFPLDEFKSQVQKKKSIQEQSSTQPKIFIAI